MVSRWLRGGDTSGRGPFKSPGSNSQRAPHTRSPTHPPRMSRDTVARGHLAPRPATQEATCNGPRASSRAFQQTMGRVCSDVMVKHQPVRETLALISATKRRYRRRMSRFAHVSHPRPQKPGGTRVAQVHPRAPPRPLRKTSIQQQIAMRCRRAGSFLRTRVVLESSPADRAHRFEAFILALLSAARS